MLTRELSTVERVQRRFIEPVQVALVPELLEGGAWTYEAKIDGYHCLAASGRAAFALWSRRGNGFTARFSSIARACEKPPQIRSLAAK